MKKSGSSGGSQTEGPSFDDSAVDWDFSEDLSFLLDNSKKRRTFVSDAEELDAREAMRLHQITHTKTIRQLPALNGTIIPLQSLQNISESLLNTRGKLMLFPPRSIHRLSTKYFLLTWTECCNNCRP